MELDDFIKRVYAGRRKLYVLAVDPDRDNISVIVSDAALADIAYRVRTGWIGPVRYDPTILRWRVLGMRIDTDSDLRDRDAILLRSELAV